MAEEHHSLDVAIRREGNAWLVELVHLALTTRSPTVRGLAAFDPVALRALQADPAGYGAALAEQLLDDPALRSHFVDVAKAAEAASCSLRLTLSIEPSAQELQALRWELLRHPDTGAVLATSERVLLSRFMVSRDLRPVDLRARSELVSLVAVAAPEGERFAKAKLALVDRSGEELRARAALAGTRVQRIEGPATLDSVIAGLRQGVDILYLVAHGALRRRTGDAYLHLQAADGDTDPVLGRELAERLSELQRLPRLVVLASCESATQGDDDAAPPAHLAAQLAEVGIPAVVAMQGKISMETVEAFMPAFFESLQVDGRIDRALAVARGRVRDRHDAWMPVLYTRLRDGKLWYTPGFGAGRDERRVWEDLVDSAKRGRLLPVVGPGLYKSSLGDTHDLAHGLSQRWDFPLAGHQAGELPRVMQYLEVKKDRFSAVERLKEQMVEGLTRRHGHWLGDGPFGVHDLGRLLQEVAVKCREEDDDPFRVLAELRSPLYLTTAFDWMLEDALLAAGQTPQQSVASWRRDKSSAPLDDNPPLWLGAEGEEPDRPTSRTPLVHHAFGAFGPDRDDTLVLTEDDYLDYLSRADRMYHEVEGALVSSALLFVGFRLTDWRFRMLFRQIVGLGGSTLLTNFSHVGVQLEPELHDMTDAEGAKDFLQTYMGTHVNIAIYWGSSREFLKSLRDELAKVGGLTLDRQPTGGRGF